MNTLDASLPRSFTVRGYEIRRMPLGKYLQAIRVLETLPQELAGKLVPQGEIRDVLNALQTPDANQLMNLILKALSVVPQQTVEIVAVLTDISVDTLLSDNTIGADGFLEIVEAWLTINDMENFMQAARRVVEKIQRLVAVGKRGCKG